MTRDPRTAGSSFRTFGAVAVLALSVAGCGGSKDKLAVGIEHSTAETRTVKRPAPRAVRLFVANVRDRIIGPFAARGVNRSALVWVESADEGKRSVRGLVTDDVGVAIEPTRDLAPDAGDIATLVVKHVGGSRFISAWASMSGGRGEAVSVLGIAPNGTADGTAVAIARTNEHIVWLDVMPVPGGAVVAWAEETKDGRANLLAVAVDERGKARGVPSYAARGVVGWRAVATAEGVTVGLLTDAATRKKEGAGFALSLLRIGPDARPIETPTPIVREPVVQPDFDMVRLGREGTLIAWTDRTGLEPEVKTITVDDRGRAGATQRVVGASSGAKVLVLTALTKGALLAWEEPTRRQKSARRVHLTRVAANGGSAAEAVLELEGQGVPEIVARGDGAAILSRMRVCDARDTEQACASAPFAPAVMEIDESLAAVRAERLVVGDTDQPVSLAWGLSCAAPDVRPSGGRSEGLTDTAVGCLVLGLGAQEGEGQPVVAVPFGRKPVSQRVAVSPLYAPGRPRPKSLTTELRSDPVAALAAATTSVRDKDKDKDNPSAGWTAVLTRGQSEGPTKKRGLRGSAAAIYLVPAEASASATEAVPFASRADVAVGVSMLPVADGSFVLAWGSREEGGARVHLTRIGPAGRKGADLIVTTRRGELSDVQVVAVAGGFVVGWVDDRDGNGEVYTAKVTEELARVGEHQRITHAKGDASDLRMVAHPSGVVWLAWTDSRESPTEGNGDIYVASVRAKDARRATDDVRVLATAAHSRSPSLAATDSGIALAWIEESPLGNEADRTDAHGAMLTWLDARAHALRDPVRVRGAGAGAGALVVLDPTRAGTRGLLVRSAPESLDVDAFTVEGVPAAAASPVVAKSSWLVSPEGPPTLDLPVVLDGDNVHFAEEGRSASEHRVRRMSIIWP